MNDARRAAVKHADASTPSVAIFTSEPRHVIVLESYYEVVFFPLILFTVRLVSNYLSRIFPPCGALDSPPSRDLPCSCRSAMTQHFTVKAFVRIPRNAKPRTRLDSHSFPHISVPLLPPTRDGKRENGGFKPDYCQFHFSHRIISITELGLKKGKLASFCSTSLKPSFRSGGGWGFV